MAESGDSVQTQAEAPSADAVADAVAALTLTAPTPDTFSGVHDALPSFSTVEDLGVFVWHPHSPSNADFKSHAHVTVSDIRDRLEVPDGLVGVPIINISDLRLPVEFKRLTPQSITNRFPNDPGVATALFAAATRGLVVDTVDFVFGGSALNVLSSRNTYNNVYLVQRVGQAIVIGKHSEYTGDLAAKGFQFERFVTGGRMAALSTEDCVVGMQLADVGPFRIFFHAELDAVDADGARVEIKSGNPSRFGVKEMLQMVSSRSSSLLYANCRGNRLLAVQKPALQTVAKWVTEAKRLALQDVLLKTMREIKDMAADISDGEPSQLAFTEDGHVELRARPGLSMLPPADVIATLIGGKE